MGGRPDGGDVEEVGEFLLCELYIDREHARGEPGVIGGDGEICEKLVHHIRMEWDGKLEEEVEARGRKEGNNRDGKA